MSKPKAKPDDNTEWATLSHDDVEDSLAVVRHGGFSQEKVAQEAIDLMAYFYFQIENGRGYDIKQLEVLVHHAFGKVVNDGWSADQGFGLKPTRGRYVRKHIDDFRDLELAAAMRLLNKHLGYSWDSARAEVAKLFPAGEKAAEAAYKEYREEIELLNEAGLKEMLPDDVVKHLPSKRHPQA